MPYYRHRLRICTIRLYWFTGSVARNAFDKIKIDSKLNMLIRNDKAISSIREAVKELSIGGDKR